MSDAQPHEFVAPTLDELNERIPGYDFVAFIAKGGMGAVYLARQTSLDRLVAIKVLPPVLCENEDFKESFETEAKLMAKLNHPNLVGIFDFGNFNGMLYIVMEYVKGKSLFHSARGKMIEQETAVNIISGVCEGLAHAHEAGMLHRDVKPANILLNKKATPKIGDFGLARPSEMTETGAIFGTPDYSAPEVLGSPEKVDERTDVYAVGVILYELLTGQLPRSPYVSVTDFADCDPRFDFIIKRAINPNIEMRYVRAEELSEALNNVINNSEPENKFQSGGKLVVPPRVDSSPSGVRDSIMSVSVANAGMSPTAANAPKVKQVEKTGVTEVVKIKAPEKQAGVVPLPTTTAVKDNSTKTVMITLGVLAVCVIFGGSYWVMRSEKDRTTEIKDKQDIAAAADTVTQEKELKELEDARIKLQAKTAAAKADRVAAAQKASIIIPSLKKLADLKEKLVSGERPLKEMPKEIFMRSKNTRMLMFIDIPMTWDEADAWAEEYGGYIAVCATYSDFPVISKKIPKGTTSVWLGGGNAKQSWAWIEGTPWLDSISLPPTSGRDFITLSSEGSLGIDVSIKKRPFFIEWRADGANPAALKDRLAKVNSSLASASPDFPIGAFHEGGRHYYLVKSSLLRKEAAELASAAGGHLIAISSAKEGVTVSKILTENTEAGATFWSAGLKKDALWSWQNGEKWLKFNWSNSEPGNDAFAAIETAGELTMKELTEENSPDGFIIEWSNDNKQHPAAKIDFFDLAKLADFKTETQESIQQLKVVTAEKHVVNVNKLLTDLNDYLLALNTAEQDAVVEHMGDNAENEADTDVDTEVPAIVIVDKMEIRRVMKGIEGQARLDEELANSMSSKKANDFVNAAMELQKRIDMEHFGDLQKTKTQYTNRLTSQKSIMAGHGQASMAAILEKELDTLVGTEDDFETYIK